MPESSPPIDVGRLRRRLLELVRIPSQTGNEGVAVDRITAWLRPFCDEVERWSTPVSELERDPDYPGREVERADVPVVAARVRGRRPGRGLLLTGHVDVVPPGDPGHWYDLRRRTRDPRVTGRTTAAEGRPLVLSPPAGRLLDAGMRSSRRRAPPGPPPRRAGKRPPRPRSRPAFGPPRACSA